MAAIQYRIDLIRGMVSPASTGPADALLRCDGDTCRTSTAQLVLAAPDGGGRASINAAVRGMV